ncbi:MAG: aspartate ammonia-lyase [Chloroflexi bacterium]|nr:aspartate ammonia-lyase [Chloroflexota bacterium]
MATRLERDSLGEREVPQEVYYGIQTLRAVENFPVSGLRAHPYLIKALAYVKKATALANMATGQLEPTLGRAIVQAAEEVLKGQWQEQFVVDVYQAGAGVSLHMNMNEVLANRAIEILGGKRGDYSLIHPNDHVNHSQSTNDVFPTAVRVAALLLVKELLPVVEELESAFRQKAGEFQDILKAGRTHMQDAVPITLGQEFKAYAHNMRRNYRRIDKVVPVLAEVNLGGTAVGTGINAHPEYLSRVVPQLAELTGLKLSSAEDRVESTQNPDAFAELSAALKLLALDLIKISHDLVLLSSGPRTGFGEINLPPLQPGSSIMPGKVNPVMAEMMSMVAYQVVGNDEAIALAIQSGQLELNIAMPLMGHCLLQSLAILKNAIHLFAQRCVLGITANEERCRQLFEGSLGLATILNPYIGYQSAADIAKEALRTGRTIREIVLERGLLSKEELNRLLSPKA